MHIKLRLNQGTQSLELNEHETLETLLQRIEKLSKNRVTAIKFGYPPKNVPIDVIDVSLSSLGISDGSMIVIETGTQSQLEDDCAVKNSSKDAVPQPIPQPDQSLPPEVACESGNMVLRVMEDDNSCLFRAVGYACMRNLDCMVELRSMVANIIQENISGFYSEAILGQPRDKYCEWISRPDSWGGGIELQILSQHFDVEICSIDVASGRMDCFNQGKSSRCFLVYSGIHYDCLALSPGSGVSMEYDQTIFQSDDSEYFDAAKRLCEILRQRHYYTDTAAFSLKCHQCGAKLIGETAARKHAELTSHTDFGECT